MSKGESGLVAVRRGKRFLPVMARRDRAAGWTIGMVASGTLPLAINDYDEIMAERNVSTPMSSVTVRKLIHIGGCRSGPKPAEQDRRDQYYSHEIHLPHLWPQERRQHENIRSARHS
jgi:hypothetical protein